VNLVKADSYISSKEDGEERLQHLIRAFRADNNLPELTEDGGAYADGIKRSGGGDAKLKKRKMMKKKHHHGDGDEDVSKIAVTSGPNFLYRWGLLCLRSGIMQLRDPLQVPARLIQALFLAFLVGFLYLQVLPRPMRHTHTHDTTRHDTTHDTRTHDTHDTRLKVWWRDQQIGDNQRSITDRQGSLFFVVMSLSMGPMMGCLVVFQAERVIFIREHSTGCYSTLAYYLTKVVAEIPALLVVPVVQGTISYWMVGYQSAADRYFIFIAACIAVTLVAHALGLSISAGAPNLDVSMAISPILFIPLMLLGGFYLSDDSIPKWLIWCVIYVCLCACVCVRVRVPVCAQHMFTRDCVQDQVLLAVQVRLQHCGAERV